MNAIKKIKDLMRKVKCPQDFRCLDPAYARAYQSRPEHAGFFLFCVKTKPAKCKYAYKQNGSILCRCPVRLYVTIEMKK